MTFHRHKTAPLADPGGTYRAAPKAKMALLGPPKTENLFVLEAVTPKAPSYPTGAPWVEKLVSCYPP